MIGLPGPDGVPPTWRERVALGKLDVKLVRQLTLTHGRRLSGKVKLYHTRLSAHSLNLWSYFITTYSGRADITYVPQNDVISLSLILPYSHRSCLGSVTYTSLHHNLVRKILLNYDTCMNIQNKSKQDCFVSQLASCISQITSSFLENYSGMK